MTKPVTMPEAEERGLVTETGKGIHTFSNGSEWDAWASGNCFECRYYDRGVMGKHCALEGAAFCNMLSPELAQLFGWTQDPQWDKPDDHRSGWNYPEKCPHFREHGRDDDPEPTPDPDPQQLVLLADPTEAAAVFATAPNESLEPVGVPR